MKLKLFPIILGAAMQFSSIVASADGLYLCQNSQTKEGLVLVMENGGKTATFPINGANETLVNTGKQTADSYILFRGSRQVGSQIYEFAAFISPSLAIPNSTKSNEGVVGTMKTTTGSVLSCKNFAGRG